MKKIFTLILTIALCCSFTACETANDEFNENRFLYVNTNGSTGIYVDKETRVMYLWVRGSYKGGLTIMLDENGKPLLWEGDL